MRLVSLLAVLTVFLAAPGVGAQTPVALDVLTNDSCANPTEVEWGRVYRGDTLVATDQAAAQAGRGGGSPDVVFAFTLHEARQVLLSRNVRTDIDFYSLLYIRTDCDDPSTQVHDTSHGRLVNQPFRYTLGPGRYYVFLDGDAPPPLDRGTYSLQFSQHDPPLGDLCDNPWPLEFDELALENSRFYSPVYRSKNVRSGGRDIVFRFTLTEATKVLIDSKGSKYDTTMYLREVCDDIDGDIDWGDHHGEDPYSTFQARITEELEPGTYYAILDAWAVTEFGQFNMLLTEVDE